MRIFVANDRDGFALYFAYDIPRRYIKRIVVEEPSLIEKVNL